jgi:hypothetical protein
MSGKEEESGPSDEVDLLKVFVWLMLVMTVALAGAWFWMQTRRENTEKLIASGKRAMANVAEEKAEIQAMLKVFTNNREDEARYNHLSWFSKIWKSKGISKKNVTMLSWRDPPEYKPKGGYYEESIGLKFQRREPLPRRKIAEFCHAIEQQSARLRILELKLQRPEGDKFDTDLWYGQMKVGYRYPRVNE